MLAGSLSRVKKKATLLQLTKEVIMHVIQALLLTKDDLAKSRDLILNIFIKDLIEDMDFNDLT